jgi:hypothetical protein
MKTIPLILCLATAVAFGQEIDPAIATENRTVVMMR